MLIMANRIACHFAKAAMEIWDAISDVRREIRRGKSWL